MNITIPYKEINESLGINPLCINDEIKVLFEETLNNAIRSEIFTFVFATIILLAIGTTAFYKQDKQLLAGFITMGVMFILYYGFVYYFRYLI